jgi:hypothetical protein
MVLLILFLEIFLKLLDDVCHFLLVAALFGLELAD